MRLDEVRELLTTTTAAQWAKLEIGPLYREGYTMYGFGGESSIAVRWHQEAAVFREDVDLTLQWGMDQVTDQHEGDGVYEWSQGLVDKKARTSFVDVFWRGVLVDRYVLASIDGGHGLVPMPYTSNAGHYPTVNTRQVQVTKLIADLEGGHVDPIDRVLESHGFEVERDWG